MAYIGNILVSDRTLNEIKMAIGYPVIKDEFKFIMDDDQIKELVIAPSLETYFQYFPILERIVINIGGGMSTGEYPTPTETLGVIRSQFVPQTNTIFSNLNNNNFYANPFATANSVLSIGGRGGSGGGYGRFGTPNTYGSDLFNYQNRFLVDAQEAMNRVWYLQYDEQQNKVFYKSVTPGTFYFELAKWSRDVETVPIQKRQSFINYTRGMLKKSFANILGMTEGDLPVSIDVDNLNDEGDRLIENEINYWREASSIPMMRG
jgi:hypothetical protein